MFKAPFSFDGRIRRTEYGLSLIIFIIVLIILASLPEKGAELLVLLLFIPAVWFILAQGAKRCHDLGNNGWFQIIPFYIFVMIFQDSDRGENGEGVNPKGIGNEDSYDDLIKQIGKSLES